MDGPSGTNSPSSMYVASELKQASEFKLYYKTLLSENLGTHCQEWLLEKPVQNYKCLLKPA